jgi:hypothetical protein
MIDKCDCKWRIEKEMIFIGKGKWDGCRKSKRNTPNDLCIPQSDFCKRNYAKKEEDVCLDVFIQPRRMNRMLPQQQVKWYAVNLNDLSNNYMVSKELLLEFFNEIKHLPMYDFFTIENFKSLLAYATILFSNGMSVESVVRYLNTFARLAQGDHITLDEYILSYSKFSSEEIIEKQLNLLKILH